MAERIRPLTSAVGVPFIINDHPWLVPRVGADGAHIGQDDGPADRRAGKSRAGQIDRTFHPQSSTKPSPRAMKARIISASVPCSPRRRKPYYQPIGLEEIARVHAEITDAPIFCIGGIKLENLSQVIDAGARRVVIVSGLLLAEDVASYARRVLGTPSAPLKTHAVSKSGICA